MLRSTAKSHRSQAKVVSADPTPPTESLSLYGADSETFYKTQKIGQQIHASVMNGDRPSNMYLKSDQSAYWWPYNLMDYYRHEVSILATVIHRIPKELFRYGLEFRPKFARRCEACGYEAQTVLTECPQCKSTKLRRPDRTQLEYFKRPDGRSFLECANNNGQTLCDVLRMYAELEVQDNQAYNVCITGDIVDRDTGHLLKAYPLEFVVYDPKFVRMLFDETGRPGLTYGFIREDRETLISLDMSEDALNDVTESGLEIYPAFWQVGTSFGATGMAKVYAEEEVYQDHWYGQSLTYGFPIGLDIEDDLQSYHFLEKHTLKRYKYGYVRKILIMPGFSDDDAENIAQGIKDVLAKNDNSIPIVCTPAPAPGVAEMKAQMLELGTEDGAQALQHKTDVRDRICAIYGIPNIFVGDTEASGGMNNESQQITIFDRYLMDLYERVDNQCRWILSWFPGITDWELVVNRPSKAYTDAKRRMEKIQEAQAMQALGFRIYYEDGEFRYSSKTEQELQKEEQARAQANQPAPDLGRGLMAGDGYGPPEKGTARREDAEIGGSEDEIDLSKREADSAMEV